MPAPYPISNRYKVTTQDHGQILKLGNAAEGFAGTWSVQFVPDATFTGGLAVVGRIDHPQAQTDNVPFVAIPYRAAYLNSAAADDSLVSTVITSGSKINVPSRGDSVAFLVSCEAGFGYLYSKPVDGSATP